VGRVSEPATDATSAQQSTTARCAGGITTGGGADGTDEVIVQRSSEQFDGVAVLTQEQPGTKRAELTHDRQRNEGNKRESVEPVEQRREVMRSRAEEGGEQEKGEGTKEERKRRHEQRSVRRQEEMMSGRSKRAHPMQHVTKDQSWVQWTGSAGAGMSNAAGCHSAWEVSVWMCGCDDVVR
jgi:hypothetical protein